MFGHIVGILSNPETEWQKIRTKLDEGKCNTAMLVVVLALIPPVCGYIGTTVYGWQIGAGDPIKLTNQSAGLIALLYFGAIVVGINIVAMAIQWMGQTYETNVPFKNALALASFCAVPLLLIGVFEIYPVLWFNFLIGLLALAVSVRLLYSGVPIVLGVSKERGFLYASAILAFGLVALVALLAITVFLWGIGIEPTMAN